MNDRRELIVVCIQIYLSVACKIARFVHIGDRQIEFCALQLTAMVYV